MTKDNLLPLSYILLPTEDAGELYLKLNGELELLPYGKGGIGGSIPQHIYLTSQRDVYRDHYFLCSGRIQKCLKSDNSYIYGNESTEPRNICSLIEFCTDKKLIADGVPALPDKGWIRNEDWPVKSDYRYLPEVNFIEEFCNRYNKKDNQKDVEKLAEEHADTKWLRTEQLWSARKFGFIEGYNQALKSNAGFSLENVQAAIEMAREDWKDREKYTSQQIIQSITKGQSIKGDIIIECEMENVQKSINYHKDLWHDDWQIKLKDGQPILIFK